MDAISLNADNRPMQNTSLVTLCQDDNQLEIRPDKGSFKVLGISAVFSSADTMYYRRHRRHGPVGMAGTAIAEGKLGTTAPRYSYAGGNGEPDPEDILPQLP